MGNAGGYDDLDYIEGLYSTEEAAEAWIAKRPVKTYYMYHVEDWEVADQAS